MTRARDVANLIGSGNYSSTTFTATAGQTAFTISHTQGFIQVFMNGLLLDETADYTSNGSAVTLTSGAAAGDEIEVVKYNTFSVGDAIPASGGTFTGNVTHSGDVAINGTLTTTSTGTTLSSNSYNVVKIQTDKDDNGSNDDGILQFTTGSSNTVKGELRYDESESMFEIGHGDNQGHVKIDGSGRVTKPNQPYIELRGSNASRITNHGTPVIWTHFSQQTAVGITWNGSTGRITVPVAGKYIFLGKFYQWIDNATNQNVLTRLNGTTIAEYHSDYANLGNGSNTDHVIVTADIVNMAASDYIEYRINSDIYGGYPHCNLQGYLLG